MCGLSGIGSSLGNLFSGSSGPVSSNSTDGGSSVFTQLLAAKQNDIDMQKKQIETQIGIDQKEQEQVANLKKKEIESSTPKYVMG